MTKNRGGTGREEGVCRAAGAWENGSKILS
jgi:hypothetical protein